MKYLLVLLAVCVAVADVYSQTSIQVKLYQNSDFFETTYQNRSGNPVRHVQNHHFDRLTLAINLTGKKNWMHELEVFIPERAAELADVRLPLSYSFEEESMDHASHVYTYAFRYEVNKLFHTDRRLYYGLGLGINPYYAKIEKEPLVDTRYYSDLKRYGVALNLIPRAAFKITERLRIDVNVPLKVYDLRRERTFVANPNIGYRYQKWSSTTHQFFENAYTVRLGIAYVLK